jgi:hypothetical protein
MELWRGTLRLSGMWRPFRGRVGSDVRFLYSTLRYAQAMPDFGGRSLDS